MKKLLLLIMIVFVAVTAANARDNYYRDASVLPMSAQTQLKKVFKARVNLVKVDKSLGRVDEYEVVLADGTEIEFDRAGNWKSVEVGKGSEVPSAIVPESIRKYVKKTQNQKIVGIEKNRRHYKVELANDVELIFNLNGNFVRYDD